jgi:predicted nucleic acid-binding Zn ribbon protein
MAKICIVCHNEGRGGYIVQDDVVMGTIRKAKQRFGVAQNNELVVHEECFEEHRKKRERFERDLAMHFVFAAIVLIVFIVLPIFAGGFSITSVFLGLLLGMLIVGLSILHYWPKTAFSPKTAAKPAAHEAPKLQLPFAKKEERREAKKPEARKGKKK